MRSKSACERQLRRCFDGESKFTDAVYEDAGADATTMPWIV